MKNTNFQKLTIYFRNEDKVNSFKTTETYRNVTSKKEAEQILLSIRTNGMMPQIMRVFYNGRFFEGNPPKRKEVRHG